MKRKSKCKIFINIIFCCLKRALSSSKIIASKMKNIKNNIKIFNSIVELLKFNKYKELLNVMIGNSRVYLIFIDSKYFYIINSLKIILNEF